MASTRKKTAKDGREYYEIRVSRGRGKTYLSHNWYVPEGWSRTSIERELARQAADFERKVKAGEIISREEQKEKDLREKQEAAKIQTFKQYAERVFMPAITIQCSENTRATYQGTLNNWIYPAIGDIKMPEITAADITALLLHMQEEGKMQSTCIKAFTILTSLFKRAYKTDQIDRNPMDKVDRPKPRVDEVPAEESSMAFTAEELRAILACIKSEPLKWRAYIQVMADSGLRRGECCGIQWADVDLQAGTIMIRHNLQYTPGKGVYDKRPKNKKARLVYIGDSSVSLLRELRDYQADHCISKWVFTQEDSAEPMHPQSPTRYFSKLKDRYGLEDFHPHKLRHTFASISLTNGADVVSTSENLGHSDPAVTLRMYSHANEASKKQASSIFRDAVNKPATEAACSENKESRTG